MICSAQNCENNKVARYLCAKHYKQWQRYGGITETENNIHGMSNSIEYRTWASMMQRCYNPNATRYKDWGGRGIKVCERWKSFNNFYEDMGDKPEGFTLDRIDNDGDYSLKNCRWATVREQNINQRISRRNTSGYKNINWSKDNEAWRVRVNAEDDRKHVGYFESLELASKALLEVT